MKKSYVLIDYENVQPDSIAALESGNYSVLLFVGASQTKVRIEVASTLQRMGERAAYIRIAGNGSNALDFHIAFFIGQLAEREPEASFHIVSKDSGFDPLLQYLKGCKISASRVKSVSELPRLKKLVAPSPVSERAALVIANLIQRGAAKPRTLKTLESTINALFQKALSPAEVKGIIADLVKRGVVVVNQSRVSYALPAAA